MKITPFMMIRKQLSPVIPQEYMTYLPHKWEKIGDILIIKLHPILESYIKIIAKAYADVLNCTAVLKDIGSIKGTYRTPQVIRVYGSESTITIHKENNIRFKLDPAHIMFSSGNMQERIRMAKISSPGETVVDLFAGIGYFSIPMAVNSSPKKIFACEIHRLPFSFLRENIILNNVSHIVEPIFGDNRKIAPKNVAQRVIMGYLVRTETFIPLALESLSQGQGIIHFHDLCRNESIPHESLEKVRKEAEAYGKDIEMLNYLIVKSYAPSISHIVLDVRSI